MDIEEVAATRPEAVARIPVDPERGVSAATAAEIAAAAGLPPRPHPYSHASLARPRREDALLVEVNPLVRTTGGTSSPSTEKSPSTTTPASGRPVGATSGAHDDPLEAAAAAKGLNYVKLDGEVGIIGNGAGLVMSTLDVVAGCGARPANFLDIGGGASAQVMADGLSVILSRPGP